MNHDLALNKILPQIKGKRKDDKYVPLPEKVMFEGLKIKQTGKLIRLTFQRGDGHFPTVVCGLTSLRKHGRRLFLAKFYHDKAMGII